MALSYTQRPSSRGKVYESTTNTGIAQPKRSRLFRVFAYFFPVKGDGVKEGVRKVIFTGAVVCFLYFGTTVGLDLVGEYRAEIKRGGLVDDLGSDVAPEVIDKIQKEQVNKGKPEILADFLSLYDRNNDFVGWVCLDRENDIINYPVCQTNNNDYYLTADFDGNYSKGGTIFADYRCEFDGYDLSDNTILYGHNIMTGNYFAKVTRYYSESDLSWYKKYPTVEFDTIYEKSEWKVFACVLFNTQSKYGEMYPYIRTDFADKEDFNNYILDIMDRSVLLTDVDLQYGDKILTLSTCYYPLGKNVDSRCAVFARKVREGESTDVDTSVATYNRKELRWDEQVRRLGTGWTGRVWDTSKLKDA